MGHPAAPADHVARVGLVQEHIRAGVVHAEIDRPFIDDIFRRLFVEARLMRGIFRVPVISIIVGGVEKNRVSRPDVQIPPL